MRFYHVDVAYYYLCHELIKAPRCGNTRELNNIKIQIDDITDNVVSIRDISPSYLFGELLWYFNGDNSLEYISKFSSFWKKISDDGITSNSAYGYILKKKWNFNQLEKIIELLRKDPLSRRAVLNINTPNERVIETKDEPCTIALQFLIRDGALHCTAIMRSNDIWFGTPYDWAFFMELQKYIADKLGLAYGTYTHFATSLHLYDKDYEAVKKITEAPTSKPVNYDRKNFHRYSDIIYKETQKAPANVAKEKLMDWLKFCDIYQGE